MSLESWYGEFHTKSASIDASFVKNRVVGVEMRGVYKRGLVFPTIAGRVWCVAVIDLISLSQAKSSTPNASFGTIDLRPSE